MASPTHLRAAADVLRRTAAAIDADVPGVTAAGDTETWVGPAATRYRLEAARTEERATAVARALRALAGDLAQQALHVERAEALERAHARERERERRRQGWRERSRAGAGAAGRCVDLGPLLSACAAPSRTRDHG